MRKWAFGPIIIASVGVAFAQTPDPRITDRNRSTAEGVVEQAKTGRLTSKELAVQVVSTDASAKTITIKKEDAGLTDPMAAGSETTLPVEADAITDLKNVTAGEKVKLICRTNASGKETAVTAIEKDDKPKTPAEKK